MKVQIIMDEGDLHSVTNIDSRHESPDFIASMVQDAVVQALEELGFYKCESCGTFYYHCDDREDSQDMCEDCFEDCLDYRPDAEAWYWSQR